MDVPDFSVQAGPTPFGAIDYSLNNRKLEKFLSINQVPLVATKDPSSNICGEERNMRSEYFNI